MLDTGPARRLAPFLVAGATFLALALAALVWETVIHAGPGAWLVWHLALAGGVSLLVIGAAQFFACAYLATEPTPWRLLIPQLALWSTGVLAFASSSIIVGRVPALVAVGACGCALALFVISLDRMRRRSLQRLPWAYRWYVACAGFAILGGLLGQQLDASVTWAAGSVRFAHITLMVLGWCGTAIVGTVHTLFPSLVERRLAWPRLQRPTFLAWTSGVTLLACGFLTALWPLVWLGVIGLQVGGVLLLANVIGTIRRRSRPLTLPARSIAVGQALLVGGITMFGLGMRPASANPPTGEVCTALVVLFAAGWVGATVAGALVHLSAVTRRTVGRRQPRPSAKRPPRTDARPDARWARG